MAADTRSITELMCLCLRIFIFIFTWTSLYFFMMLRLLDEPLVILEVMSMLWLILQHPGVCRLVFPLVSCSYWMMFLIWWLHWNILPGRWSLLQVDASAFWMLLLDTTLFQQGGRNKLEGRNVALYLSLSSGVCLFVFWPKDLDKKNLFLFFWEHWVERQ